MSRKVLSALLIFAWVFLSAFDLLEDLKVASTESAYAQTGKYPSPRWNRHPSTANNIVESAIHIPASYKPLLQSQSSASAIHPLISSPRVLELHKLHRVLLI
ncbi:MAG TPA: hypothetical protein VJQ55_16375 [Candidatus Binatia bacterium]|nr:hypothetical protein [Candidatus Binatia bacterium]